MHVLLVQTTVGTEVIPNIISTICCLYDFFRTPRDIQVCTFNNITEGEERAGNLATIETVA